MLPYDDIISVMLGLLAKGEERKPMIPREGRWIRPPSEADLTGEDRRALLAHLLSHDPSLASDLFEVTSDVKALTTAPTRRDELRMVLYTVRAQMCLQKAQQGGVRPRELQLQALKDASAARSFGAAAVAAVQRENETVRRDSIRSWQARAELTYGIAQASAGDWGEAAEAAIRSELHRHPQALGPPQCQPSPSPQPEADLDPAPASDDADGSEAEEGQLDLPPLLHGAEARALLDRCLENLPPVYRVVLDAIAQSTPTTVQTDANPTDSGSPPAGKALLAIESLNAKAREDALPEFRKSRPKYYYYYTWMEQRIRAHCPALPEPVVQKLLGIEAGELDMLLGSREATERRARELLDVLTLRGEEGLEAYQVPPLSYEFVTEHGLLGPGSGGQRQLEAGGGPVSMKMPGDAGSGPGAARAIDRDREFTEVQGALEPSPTGYVDLNELD